MSTLRFEVSDTPPTLLSVGLAIQMVLLTIAGIVITPAIVIRAAGESSSYLEYAGFAVLIVSGLCTILQARPWWRIGSGYILMMGTSGAFIAVSISALQHGGPFLLGSLVVVSSFVQFLLAFKLSTLRKIITPTVGGIVVMLIPVTVMPIGFDMMNASYSANLPWGAPLVAGLTVLIGVGLGIRAKGILRLWTPIIGIFVGTVVAIVFGMFDTTEINQASWVGVPTFSGIDWNVSLDASFFALLPSFIFVTIIGMVETIGDSIAIQRVSQREIKSPDYRVVQGAIAADGVGNFLSGLMCVVPNTTYSSSVAIAELTGVAARRIGFFIGIGFLIAAFLPKLLAFIVSIPAPVMGGYLLIVMGMLFVVGIRMVARGGIDYRNGLVVGISLWVGVGFQYQFIFPELLTGFWGEMLQNGMTAGGLTAIFLMLLWNITSSRTVKTRTAHDDQTMGFLGSFIGDHASRWRVSQSLRDNLVLANEETLNLVAAERDKTQPRSVQLSMHKELNVISLEYAFATDLDNIEDRIALLQEAPDEVSIDDFSLKILRHIATHVEHQKYFDLDIITVKVSSS